MKQEIRKTVAAILVVVMVMALISSCGKSGKEPKDSLVPQETFEPATVPEPETSELDDWIQEALGDDVQWDGDFSALTAVQLKAIQDKLDEKGYFAHVTNEGVVYYDYTPTADAGEIAEVVAQVLPEKKWDGQYASLTAQEKKTVQKALQERGYDVDVGVDAFEFKNSNDRKAEQTTREEYNQLPSKDMLSVMLSSMLGKEGFKTWDGNFMSLPEDKRVQLVSELNEYGYHVDINEQGEMYIIHLPENKMTYDSAYSAAPIGGTTAAPTTIRVPETENKQTDENVTGTTANKILETAELQRTALKTLGGSDRDRVRHLLPTADGGILAVMDSDSRDGDMAGANETWKGSIGAVVKLDADLKIEWKELYGSGGAIGASLSQAAQLKDGSYVAVGNFYPANNNLFAQAVILRFDAKGNRTDTIEVGGSKQDEFNSVAATPDGGFVVGGQSQSGDGDFEGLQRDIHKAVLLKYSAAGEREWMKHFTGGSLATHIDALAVTPEGAIYAACQASASTTGGKLYMDMAEMAGYGGSDNIVLKIAPDGELIAHRAIAGSGAEKIHALTLCSDGGVLVGGSTGENGHPESVFQGQKNYGDQDAYLVRLDAYLNVQWVKTFGGAEEDEILAVTQYGDDFIAVGMSQSHNGDFTFLGAGDNDAFVLSVSHNGTTVQKYALNGSDKEYAYAVCILGKEIFVGGSTQSPDGVFAGQSPAASKTNQNGFIAKFAAQ